MTGHRIASVKPGKDSVILTKMKWRRVVRTHVNTASPDSV